MKLPFMLWKRPGLPKLGGRLGPEPGGWLRDVESGTGFAVAGMAAGVSEGQGLGIREEGLERQGSGCGPLGRAGVRGKFRQVGGQFGGQCSSRISWERSKTWGSSGGGVSRAAGGAGKMPDGFGNGFRRWGVRIRGNSRNLAGGAVLGSGYGRRRLIRRFAVYSLRFPDRGDGMGRLLDNGRWGVHCRHSGRGVGCAQSGRRLGFAALAGVFPPTIWGRSGGFGGAGGIFR